MDSTTTHHHHRRLYEDDDSPSSSSEELGSLSGNGQEMSTQQIMRMAAARIIHLDSRTVDVNAMFNNPFDLCLSRISYEDARNVELVEYVLAAAEKVGNRQFNLAADLLRLCDCLSSPAGNPVQRVAHYFSRALREKISRETGQFGNLAAGKVVNGQQQQPATDFQNGAVQALFEKIPFCQVAHLAGTQVVLEHVANAKRIHVIDLRIRNGMQWTPLMQALASSSPQRERHVEVLKITAVGTTSRREIEETGRRLASFAETMNIPFEFRVVMVRAMSEVRDEMFEVDPREATAVYSEFCLRELIGTEGPTGGGGSQMDGLMGAIRAIGPRVMVVVEAETNHNSSNYARRFVDALFHYGALFDCVGECVGPDDPGRAELESRVLAGWIRNVVAAEGEERRIRSVTLEVWRTFLARFGLGEAKMSALVFYQVGWVLGRFACARFCKVDINGKSIVVGWKGSPIVSISAWKFNRLRK